MSMKEKMIMWAVEMFVAKLTSDDLKKWIEMGLDLLEDKVEITPNKVDDMLVGAFAKMVRGALGTEDGDEDPTPIVVEVPE